MISNKRFFQIALIIQIAIIGFSCNNEASSSVPRVTKDTLAAKETVNPYATHDQSPMDMCYYPPDYPVLRMNGADSNTLMARVIYSRPQKNGRNIFGDTEKSLRQYGKEWRLGANEATEIEFFKPVSINGKKINKGRYIIYCIPYPDKWTIVLNSNLYTWGLHMDRAKDILKTDVPTSIQSPAVEDFTMIFKEVINGAELLMTWDNIKVILPIAEIK